MNAFILSQTPAVPDWMLFLGRFHPLIVHLPIGMLLVAALIEVAARSAKLSALREANRFVLFWGAATATLACAAGYLLAQSGGYDADALDTHQWLGYGVAATAWLTYLLKTNRQGRRVYKLVFAATVGLLFGAGHYGGNLTHGDDYLTQYMPQPMRAVAGLPPKAPSKTSKKITDINQALVYQDLVQPVLEQTCTNCHNAGKQKGDLRMDTPEALRKGGEHGPVLVAGRADESELMKRIHLPPDDDDHMPPKGKPQPSQQQIALLAWWINQGAPTDKKVAELQTPDEMKPVLASLASGTGSAPEAGPASGALAAVKAPKADEQALDALRRLNVLAMPVAQESNLLEISFVNARTFGDAQAFLLAPVAAQTVWLKLNGTAIGDQTLAQVGKCSHLRRLHLQNTRITDAGLAALKPLRELEYLNLTGTAITDAGLRHLAELKHLRALYLWQTRTTPQGVAELQRSLPGTVINTGLEAPDTQPATETDVVRQVSAEK